MIFSIFLAVLFLIAALYNLFIGDYLNASGGIAISSVLFGINYLYYSQAFRYSQFIDWLIENNDALVKNKKTLMWNKIPIQYDSKITVFELCFSFLLISLKIPVIVFSSSNKFLVGFACTLFTLLFGWWGLPWGPIYTVQVAYQNLRGGLTSSIEEMIAIELEDKQTITPDTLIKKTNDGLNLDNNTTMIVFYMIFFALLMASYVTGHNILKVLTVVAGGPLFLIATDLLIKGHKDFVKKILFAPLTIVIITVTLSVLGYGIYKNW